jgi:succinoglycan biosynthesis protein ExoM
MPEIVVAIPSFRRPQSLERLLLAVERLHTSAQVSILVADNDVEQLEAVALCDALRHKGYRWPLTCIVAAERGIAQARNALASHILMHSGADFVAMLDDDEWPSTGWLEAFLRVRKVTGADALQGAVLRTFEMAPLKQVEDCHGIAPMRHRTGCISMIDSTSNVLISRSCFEGLAPPCFDPAFALSGGEDRDFFERLRRQGKRFAWVDDAVAYAWVPSSRSTFGWVLQRAYRTGNSDMRVFLKHLQRGADLVPELAKIVGVALFYPLLLIAAAPFPRWRSRALCKLFRAAGKAAALSGHRYDEYAVVHGA